MTKNAIASLSIPFDAAGRLNFIHKEENNPPPIRIEDAYLGLG
jgi:hypothetical protein